VQTSIRGMIHASGSHIIIAPSLFTRLAVPADGTAHGSGVPAEVRGERLVRHWFSRAMWDPALHAIQTHIISLAPLQM
jgi:hypothetical protein